MTAAQSEIAIYNGRVRLGTVALKAGKHVAADSAGKRLGAFASRKIALAAVTAHAAKTKSIH